MTENKLSRRKMIAATGATVAATAALAGCGGEMKGGKVMGEDDPAKIVGIHEPYGLNPNAALPASHTGFAFKPKYITLIRISSQGPWSLDINYASFEVDPELKRDDRETLAAHLFKQTQKPGNVRKRFSEIPGNGNDANGKGYKIYARPTAGNPVDMSDFKDLGANQQEETYIWLDSANVEVSDKLLISFAPKTEKYENAEPNDTFFARAVSGDGLPGELIAIENYFVRYDADSGTFVPRKPADKASLYAMNIHFTIPGATGAADRIPIAIDPTKGNGGGYLP